MRCSLETVPGSLVDWTHLDGLAERSVFCTSAWLDYLGSAHGATPVVARVVFDGSEVGWFTGATVRRGGIPMLGSPLPGWGSSYMGVHWHGAPQIPFEVALAAIRRWSVRSLRCAHFEVLQRVEPSRVTLPPACAATVFHSYQLQLVDEETMFEQMSTNGRRNVRRARRNGLEIERVDPADPVERARFASECHAMVVAAFARRGTRPSFDVRRIQLLVDALAPSGMLLMLRARTARGQLAATNLSVGRSGGTAVFLMGGADPSTLGDRPNDAAMWEAMRCWGAAGALRLDLGGGGTYKEKFGPSPVESLWARSTVVPGAEPAREWLRTAESRWRALRGPVGGLSKEE